MTFDDLISALNATGIPFAEGEWLEADKLRQDYGVYALDGRRDMLADDKHSEKMSEGTVDLFCRSSRGNDKADLIEAAMDSIGCPWRLEYGPHYEEETGYTHWEWVFNVLGVISWRE